MYAQLHSELQEMKLRSDVCQLNYANDSWSPPKAPWTGASARTDSGTTTGRWSYRTVCLPCLSADNYTPLLTFCTPTNNLTTLNTQPARPDSVGHCNLESLHRDTSTCNRMTFK
ncbi:hypothetical protein ACLKA7_015677 [Drosophila subpalustris]